MRTPRRIATEGALARVEDQLRFERLLAQLSSRFINLPASQVDEAIIDALRQIVEMTGVDRTQLIQISRQAGDPRITHSWARAGVPAVRVISLKDMYPWALRQVSEGVPAVVSRTDRLPPECAIDQASWLSAGSKSCLVMPMKVAGEVEGAMAFGCLEHAREWSTEFVTQARIVADVFGNALAHKRAQNELHEALAFERLLANASASMLRVSLQGAGEAIDTALRSIGEFLKVERVGFWHMDGLEPVLAHAWLAPGTCASSAVSGHTAERSLLAPIARGEVVDLRDIEWSDADADADADAAPGNDSQRDHGIRALLAVPLLSDRQIVGALSIATVRAARRWPESLAPRLGLMGEAFASLLAHRQAAGQIRDAQFDAAQHRERLARMARVHTAGETSAAIAHEINQPLVAIENYALAAHRRLSSPSGIEKGKLDELLGKIATQAARAGEVIHRLRSRVQHDPEQGLVDLATLAGSAVTLAEVEGQLAGIDIQLRITGDPAWVLVDEIQIQQVLINLVRNGVEAMTESGATGKKLTVEVANSGENDAIVRVTDTGPGVPELHEKRIFEPFYSTKASGLGIGLAVCRSIVESHGGKLGYARAPGGGAEFHFTLPVTDPDPDIGDEP